MPSLFRPAQTLLVQYAHYHRDKRNIATHLVGVPLIVFGVGVLLARAQWAAGGTVLTVAWLVFALSATWYLSRGHVAVGLATVVVNGLLITLAHRFAGGSTAQWLGVGVGSFVLGWIIQFVGHYYEGRKPAFADDIVGLLVGPMFVVMEALAPFGLFKTLTDQIAREAGPTRVRDLAQPLAR